MELKKDTLNELRNLLELYKLKTIDAKYISIFYQLLNGDDKFGDMLKYKYDGTVEVIETDFRNGCIYINPKGTEKSVLRYVADWIQMFASETDIKEMYRLFYSLFLLHESEHVYQFLSGTYGIDKYSIINEINKKINVESCKEKRIVNWRYKKNPTSFSFERNANYNAFQILNELYKDTDYKRIAELNHLYNMFLGYYMKRGRVISPIDTTFKKMCINTRVCISKIPFEDKLREGMPISVDDYQKFFSVYDDKNLSDLSYDDVMKKVKSMK